MPISFTQIANNTASVTLYVGEQSVTVVYYPGRITERTIAILASFGTMDADSLAANYKALNTMFTELIKRWDVYEDEAQTIMFPLEAERLAELPVSFRMAVINAIMEDLRPEAMASQVSLNGHS